MYPPVYPFPEKVPIDPCPYGIWPKISHLMSFIYGPDTFQTAAYFFFFFNYLLFEREQIGKNSIRGEEGEREAPTEQGAQCEDPGILT